MSPEVSDKPLSFGQIALRNGLVTVEQLKQCIEEQKALQARGQAPPKLGELMVKKGYLTEAQVRTIFRLQGREGGHREVAGYKIHQKIGEGGMGAVFKATQISMDRTVALKILAPRLAKNDAFVARFLREARAVARLSHVNIIAGIDVGESNGLYYFAMEYVDGPTLRDVLNRGAMDETRAVEIALQLARALDHAGKNHLIHRDIKPDNVMLDRGGQAKLCDLGLAKSVEGGGSGDTANRTSDGSAVGTPNYMAPETARADKDIDIRADLYSLGATLYHMVTGETPFVGPAAVVVTRHLTEEPVPPHLRKPGVSRAVSAVIAKCMEKDRDDRYRWPEELVRDLERVQRGEWPSGTGPPAAGGVGAVAGAAPGGVAQALPAVPVDDGDGGGKGLNLTPRQLRHRRRRRRR